MASGFYQNFTLVDIFNNKNLKDKLPLINYKEKELGNGKVSRRTNLKSVNRQVFDTATSSARPFYKPIRTSRSGDVMIISGNMVGDHDGAVDAVYNAIVAKKQMLTWTASNADMIRSALKETEKNKSQQGLSSKLYLRVQSMQQIEGMSKRELQALMTDIMDNIVYGDNYPETQKKYRVSEMAVNSPYNYEQRKRIWRFKVGSV